MIPIRSYRIWFGNRNGSTLLCNALADTGIAGNPGEYLNLEDSQSLSDLYDASDWHTLKNSIWDAGSSDNGVFGLKNGWHSAHFKNLVTEISVLRNIPPPEISHGNEEFWSHLFPNCKHIFISRRNKVRQAVSWWKAIKDNIWHRKEGESNTTDKDFYMDNYDFDALNHLFKEAVLRECGIEQYFSENKIVPHTVIYEDFDRNYESTIRSVLDFLELDHSQITIKNPSIAKTANEHSEVWVQRFREDLQKGWDKISW